jgi:hypothetical protein
MDIQHAISLAAMPEPHYVCGVKLRPFSIGHWLLCQRFDVSFLCGTDHELGDLLLGCLICSDSYTGFNRSLENCDVSKVMSDWRYRLAGGALGVWRRRWKKLRGKLIEPRDIIGFDFFDECSKFQAYLDAHGMGWSFPNEWSVPRTVSTDQQPGQPLNSPGVMALLDALTVDLRIPVGEAMDMPIALARWRWAVHAERKGLVKVLIPQSQEEAEEDQKAADEFARKVAAGEVAL